MTLSRPSQEAQTVLVNFMNVEPGIQVGLVVDFTVDPGFALLLSSWIGDATRSDPVSQSFRRGLDPTIHFELPVEPRPSSSSNRSGPAHALESAWSRLEARMERVEDPPSEERQPHTSVMPANTPDGGRSPLAPLPATTSQAFSVASGHPLSRLPASTTCHRQGGLPLETSAAVAEMELARVGRKHLGDLLAPMESRPVGRRNSTRSRVLLNAPDGLPKA